MRKNQKAQTQDDDELKRRDDLIGSIVSAIKASAPKKGDQGSIYVTRMTQADKIFSAIRNVVRSGLQPFDDIVGPIPVGRVTEIFGPEASGKTDFIKKLVKQAWCKELYIYNPDGSLTLIDEDTEVIILYFDNEHSMVSDTGKIVIDGVEIDGILTECDVVEDMWKIFDITLDRVKEKRRVEDEKAKRMAKEKKEYRKKKFLTVAVVDTIASMSSVDEFTREWGDDDYPRMPKKLKDGFKRMVRRIGNENVIFVASNQGNEKFQKSRSYGPIAMDQKYSAPGGKALKFFASTRVCFEQKPVKYTLDEDYQFQQGYVIAFMSTKNRIKKPLREGRLVLLFDSAPNIHGEMTSSGLNNEFSILETLLFLKFAEVREDKFIEFKFRKFGIKLTTFDNMLDEDEEPSIPARTDWVAFFAAHKADIDAMWQLAIDYVHKDRGSTNIKSIDIKADQITGEEEPEPGPDHEVEPPDRVAEPQAPAVPARAPRVFPRSPAAQVLPAPKGVLSVPE
jgi:RecA/RadA recombinase